VSGQRAAVWEQPVVWPGTGEVARVAATVPLVRSDRQIRLCNARGWELGVVKAPPPDVRVILWRNQAFLHWQGDEWRVVRHTTVGRSGT
jgi:hypothetical protein